MNRKTQKGPSTRNEKGTHRKGTPTVPSFQRDRGRPTLHADGMLPPLAAMPALDDVDLMRVVKRTNALPLETLL